jgi:hypothetical protein
MSQPAIPTRYKGINMRSRLEARWAAMFDLWGWRWEYEPLELHGYVPDFLVHLDTPLLVEVKPAVARDASVEETIRKIEASGWPGDAWIAPLSPLGAYRGWMRAATPDWDDAYLFGCASHLGICSSWSGRCLVCGSRSYESDASAFISACWAEAGNLTQWRGADARPENALERVSGAEATILALRKGSK